MIPIEVRKESVAQIIDCLENGKSIAPPKGGWNLHTMLELAGVCHFFALACGAKLYNPEWTKDHPEWNVEREEQLRSDIQGAIAFCSTVAWDVDDGTYDQLLEPRVRVNVESTPYGFSAEVISGLRCRGLENN